VRDDVRLVVGDAARPQSALDGGGSKGGDFQSFSSPAGWTSWREPSRTVGASGAGVPEQPDQQVGVSGTGSAGKPASIPLAVRRPPLR
jgi:hypothetical protein